MSRKISDEEIKEDLFDGLTLEEIGIKHNLSSQWKYTIRARCVRGKFKQEMRYGKRSGSPVTRYFIPLEEVVRRYGRCGSFKEKTIGRGVNDDTSSTENEKSAMGNGLILQKCGSEHMHGSNHFTTK